MNRDVVNTYISIPKIKQAIQFNGVNIDLIREFTGAKSSAFHRKNNKFYINTLEGLMLVEVGDYVVRGIVGEFYAVRQDVFEQTYKEHTDGDAEINP